MGSSCSFLEAANSSHMQEVPGSNPGASTKFSQQTQRLWSRIDDLLSHVFCQFCVNSELFHPYLSRYLQRPSGVRDNRLRRNLKGLQSLGNMANLAPRIEDATAYLKKLESNFSRGLEAPDQGRRTAACGPTELRHLRFKRN